MNRLSSGEIKATLGYVVVDAKIVLENKEKNKMEWTINNSRYAVLKGARPVNQYEGKTINLLTLEELQDLQKNAPDTIIIIIFGDEVKASKMDGDDRNGYVAGGFLQAE